MTVKRSSFFFEVALCEDFTLTVSIIMSLGTEKKIMQKTGMFRQGQETAVWGCTCLSRWPWASQFSFSLLLNKGIETKSFVKHLFFLILSKGIFISLKRKESQSCSCVTFFKQHFHKSWHGRNDSETIPVNHFNTVSVWLGCCRWEVVNQNN